MRGPVIFIVTLWAGLAAAEEAPGPRSPRAAILEALAVQAGVPAELPRLPEAAGEEAEAAREVATDGARREAAQRARREAVERARRMAGQVPPGAGAAVRGAAPGTSSGTASEASAAASQTQSEAVRRSTPRPPEPPPGSRPTQPQPLQPGRP